YDPTIQSMLTMLDSINGKFRANSDFYSRLIDNEQPVITFLFLNLHDFKLTDDLYIKMNSRGKPLTAFENFKAKFEQYLGTISIDKVLFLTHNNTVRTTTLREYFSHKIDTDWANLFWNYKDLVPSKSSKNADNTFDDELMNFFRV